MEWLKQINKDRIYTYIGPEGEEIKGKLKDITKELALQKELEGDPHETFEYEGVVFTRVGFSAAKLNMATKVVFEKNGRKGYKIGNDYISATKENYMKTGETSTVLSSSYKKHLDGKIDDAMDFYAKDQKKFEKSKTKGSVSISKPAKLIKE